MIILAIETSCDDTCIALAECSANKFKLLSNLVSSQIEIHKKWGGVYPALARREHQRNLVPLLKKSLHLRSSSSKKGRIKKEAELVLKKIIEREPTLYKQLKEFLEKYPKPKIDLIAVTVGPGLDPCLWTGVNFAKSLAFYWDLPIVGINHIEAHILANFLPKISSNFDIQELYIHTPANQGSGGARFLFRILNFENIFPAICLIVSGGHTQLILMKGFGDYKILGETRDDAAGEAFDKIARILGLGYPGGPAIADAAEKFLSSPAPVLPAGEDGGGVIVILPRPMLYSKNYDFSFSGLKTAVLYNYKRRTKKEKESKKYIRAMAYEAQQAIIDVLIRKTIKAAKDYRVKSILLGGGVTANKELRKQFQEKIKKEKSGLLFNIPCSAYCTDNAAMIAITSCSKTVKGQTFDNLNSWQKIAAQPNLRI